MRIRAVCDHCGRDFLFLQLYLAEPRDADRCPHCTTHLGVVGLRHLARAADDAGTRLGRALGDIAARNPTFELRTESVLERLEQTAALLSRTEEERPNADRRARRRAA
jgi:hypothetical protein